MEHLDPPDPVDWDERRLWFEAQEAARSEHGAPAFSEQASALLIDLQAAFCAGAWTAVIILAAAIAQSQMLASGRRGSDDEGLRWLRDLRNRLLHEDRKGPAITVEQQWTSRPEWEAQARRAVCLVFEVMYPGPRQEDRAGRDTDGRPDG